MFHLPQRLSYLLLSLLFLLLFGMGGSIGQGSLYLSRYSGKLYEANVLWLSQRGKVEQEFVANYPGLSRIDVFVKWQNDSPEETPVSFYLRETCDAENNINTQQAMYPSGKVEDRTFYSFSFSPLSESTNRKYCFVLKSNTPDDDKNLIGVLASSADIYPEGRAFYQPPPLSKTGSEHLNAPIPRSDSSLEYRLFLPIILVTTPNYENIDLAFQLHYNMGWRLETFSVFFMHLAEHKPYLWGSPWFYIILMIVYISGVTIFIGGTILRESLEEENDTL
ncbi:MAG: hypothetical protein BroJett011_37830 [Chloroflexota bacterium]|nr:MAG: hypothetical protein BroJett011_37830 [Chloroflexota bacterium]